MKSIRNLFLVLCLALLAFTAMASPAFAQGPWTITATVTGAGGNISPAGAVVVANGAGQAFSMTPAATFHVLDVLVDAVSVGAVTSYTFNNVTADHSISVTFDSTFTITASSGANGTVTPSGVTVKGYGESEPYTITPAANYQIGTLTVDGAPVAVTTPTVGMSYTFTNVTANHTIAATFVFTYHIVSLVTGGNGTISPPLPAGAGGDVSVGAGANQTFTMTASLGYHVETLEIDAVDQGPPPLPTSYPFTNVAANHTITATFAINTYTLTPSAGANGTIAPNTPQTVNYDGSLTFTITPNAGYVIRLLIDGVEDTSYARGAPKNYTFTHVSANHAIAATFDAGTPVITPAIGPKSVLARGTLVFQVSATDPGNHDVTWSLDAPSLAKGMTIAQGVGANRMKGNFSWTPWRDQIGTHNVVFTVADAGGNFATETVVITVNCNPATIIPPATPRTLVAGYPNTIPVVEGMSADTADVNFITTGDTTSYPIDYRLPAGASIANLAGVDRMRAALNWTPNPVTQLGAHVIRFTAADSCAWAGAAPNTPTDTVFSTPVTLNVVLGNPVVTLPGTTAPYYTLPLGQCPLATDTINPGGNNPWPGFSMRLYATDPVPSGTADVVWTIDPAFPAPAWATLVDSGGTSLGAAYHGIPACTDAGVDTVAFIATDPVGVSGTPLSDTIRVIITVRPGNPVAGVLGSHDTLDVMTTTVMNYTLSATDPNNFVVRDSVTWSVPQADTLGTALVLTNNANWSAHFDWTPGPAQAGVHQFHFIATDNWGCADTELVTIIVSSTRMLSVPFDTIPKAKIDVPLLKFKIGLDGYALTSLKISSRIQKEFAISKLSLWKNNASAPFATSPITARFDDNIEKTLTGFSILLDSDDTITVKVDTWPERIDADSAYHMTGLELVIPPNGMVFDAPTPLPDANLFPYYICNTTAIDSITGIWKGVPNYRVRFDLFGPQFTVAVDTVAGFSLCNDFVHVGTKLAFHVYGLNEKIPDSTITVNLSAFGITNPYKLKNDNPSTGTLRHFYNPNWNSSTAFVTQEWYDTVTVADDNLDFDTGYKITFVAKDKYLNEGKNYYTFNWRIDTIKPRVDSLKLFLSQNNVGDTSATIGDELTLTAYLGSSGYFKVKSVSADLSRFGEAPLALEDVTNGNNVWRGKFILNHAVTGVDIPWGADSLRKSVIITADDSACNVTLDTAYLRNALDLGRPQVNTKLYMTKADSDTSNATNIGDSVYVRIDLKDNADISKVWANFKEAGLGGLTIQPLFDDGTHNDSAATDGIWSLGWRIGKQSDPTLDPLSVDAKDANFKGVGEDYDAVYACSVYVQDDAGLVDTLVTDVLTRPQGGVTFLDTRRPSEINHNFVQIKQLTAGKIRLIWPRKTYAQAEDARQFYVYVDSAGGSGFDFGKSHIFGTTYDGEYEAEPGPGDTLNAWTSEILSSNKTYRFVVRTRDDGGNFELNTTPYVAVPDGEAPFACVVYPALSDTGKYWGAQNPLIVTATTTSTDLAAAWIMYRNTDLGGGIPGDWTRYAPNMSVAPGGMVLRDTVALPQLAQYKGHYEFYIIAQDSSGNVLLLDSAKAHCPAFTFFWEPQTIQPDFLAINGALSPQSSCGFNVWRDSLNTAKVTVIGGDTSAAIYTIDSWVIMSNLTIRDSVRIEYKDLQKIPSTYSFSVNDWPKSGSGVATDLYVMITNTRNGASGVAMVTLCVPDVKAPNIRISYPTAYSRVPLAKSSLNRVPVRAKIVSTSYDPTLPIRMEFFYQVDGTTDWVKIGETGTEGANGFEVAWDNSKLSEGWVWLKAKVTDNANNTMETPLIKVFLDKTAPLMTLTLPDAITVNGGLVVRNPGPDEFINLNAEITNTTIDIAKVEFFISYRDSIDLVKYYHLIGVGEAGLNNSIWRYKWYINEWITGSVEHPGWMKCGFDYKLRVKVTDIAGNVYDDEDGDGQFDDYTFWQDPFVAPINLNTPKDDSKKLFTLDCGAPQVAINEIGAGDRTYQTPSSLLGGPAVVYMKKGETLTAQSIVLDSLNDLGGVKMVEYFFYSPVYGAYKSVGFATASPFSKSFDPFALGLITDASVMVNEYESHIKAVLTDSLNQTTSDEITCWVLDNFPGDSKWKTPTMPYVWGSVDLSIWALNHESYREVTYKYKPTAGGDWTTIATVRLVDDASRCFLTQWPTLNQVTDGSYILGFETTDKNLNVQPVENNPQITVIVQNALPIVAIKSPTEGAFFCEDQYFTADATNGPVSTVDFQYKKVTSSSWTNFPDPADNFPPYGKYFTDTTLSDGYYHFRAFATNQAGRTAYSEPITLFYDGTDPLARITDLRASLGGVTDTVDVEWQNDGSAWINKAIGTVKVTAVAFDTLSPVGSQAIYNSGIAWVGLYLTTPSGPEYVELAKEYPNPADSGYYTFTWDISGLPTGSYKLKFEAWDKVGCNMGSNTVSVEIIEFNTPFSLVAGFWQPVPGHGKIVGVSYHNESVQFQYKQTGDWIPIGIGRSEKDKSLFYPDQRWQNYSVYVADWAPADGNYQLRMLTSYGEDYSPILSVSITNGVMTVTSNPATGWGPGTIERNQEEGCNLDGVARFNSSYGYPFAVATAMDLDDLEFYYELIDFRNLPQQTPESAYAGPFRFRKMEWGGPSWGKVFFCDNSGTTGYAFQQGLQAFWITQDLGSGGTIVSSPNGKDTIWVSVPPEWNDDRAGYQDALVIWGSTKPDPCVVQDMVLTPVGNRDGQSNYVGLPGLNCQGLCGTGSDERYAIVKMTYDKSCNTPAESLMVAYWDGEGEWHTDAIYRTSKVAWINTVDHTVEFATTCLKGTYALIKRTPYVGEEIVTRKNALPICGGQYTNGYPVFWYQFVEAFPYTLDWSTLEVKVDGILVYEGGNYYVGGVKIAPKTSTTLDGTARHWDIDVDDVSAVVSVKYRQRDPGVLDDPLPLACGNHTIWIGARTTQFSLQYLNDPFVVDCTKPVVTFPNKYVGKDPTIQFTITDDLSGVEWDSVFADVFFVTKMDSTNIGYDYGYSKERVSFIQSFFPGQIKNYMTGNGNVAITTSYNLENVRGMLVVVYNGHRRVSIDSDQNWGIDPGAYSQFDEYYLVNGGAPDCVGNNATPHVQYFTVDSKAPSIVRTSTTTVCPMVFTIADDGSGIDAGDIVIRENGTALPSSAEQSTASAVNGGGKWFFAPSGGGGTLYYCPTAGAKAEIAITDYTGNQVVFLVSPESTLGEGDVVGDAGPNPFDPSVDGSMNIRVHLNVSARVTVKVYDMGGDLVTTLRSSALMNAGDNLVGWNGTTEGGTTVANGVYLAHIEVTGVGGGNASTVVKIAVVQK